MAPEVIRDKTYSEKSDVYSFGMEFHYRRNTIQSLSSRINLILSSSSYSIPYIQNITSVGLILWQLLFRDLPFSQYTSKPDLFEGVCNRHDRPAFYNPPGLQYPRSVRSLIESCWDKDPARRPYFKDSKYLPREYQIIIYIFIYYLSNPITNLFLWLIVVPALDEIVIESVIMDKEGQQFWKDNFMQKVCKPSPSLPLSRYFIIDRETDGFSSLPLSFVS